MNLKEIKKLVIWILLNSFYCFLLYYGAYKGNSGASNVLMFFSWINFVSSVLCVSIKEIKEKMYKEGPSVNNNVNFVYSFIFAGCLAYCGWFFFAGLEVVSVSCQIGIYTKQEDKE